MKSQWYVTVSLALLVTSLVGAVLIKLKIPIDFLKYIIISYVNRHPINEFDWKKLFMDWREINR